MGAGTQIPEEVKQAGAKAYCELMGIRESVFLENLDRELEAPQYPDAGELWACDTLEELRTQVEGKTSAQPLSFFQKAQVAYLNTVSNAMGIPTVATARPRRPRQSVAAVR